MQKSHSRQASLNPLGIDAVKQQAVEKVWKDLQVLLEELPSSENRAKEDEIFQALLTFLSDPQAPQDLTLKCLVQFSEWLEEGGKRDLAEKTFKALGAPDDQMRATARRAVLGLLNLLAVKSTFISALVTTLAPKLVNSISQITAKERFELLKAMVEKAPLAVKAYNKHIEFMGNHFNAGIKLGKGKFGKVFLGYNQTNAAPVAIKIIDWRVIMKDKQPQQLVRAKKQLTNEIAIMKQVTHVNAVQLYEVVQVDQRIFIIMEYVAGGDLGNYLRKKGRIPEPEARHWLQNLAAGLKYLREKNILHRDLKPENLLLTEPSENGILKISDFGLGRFLGPGELAETHVGTPLYMAPEVFRPIPFTEKCDLWSVGIITYEMVVGELPYKGNNISQLLHNISHQSLIFPPDIGLSEEIKHLLTGLLQKDADMRLGWNEFFAHRCLQPITPRAATPKSSASSSTTSAAALKQIAQLEAELQEKEQEIGKLNETIAKWDEEKANQFNKIKELFERENNELRAALETQKKEGKEREELLVTQMNEMKKQHMAEMATYKDMLSSREQKNVELEKQNYAFKSSVEQHLSVIQQQEMIINAQDEERVKRKKEKERRSRELPVKEKSKNMLELVAPSQVRETLRPGEATLKMRTNVECRYRTNSKYKCVVWLVEFLGQEGNRLRLHFDSKGDATLGAVQNANKSRIIAVNTLGRPEDTSSPYSPVLFSSHLEINEKNRVLGSLDFIAASGFLQNTSYFFVYGHTGYSHALLFEL